MYAHTHTHSCSQSKIISETNRHVFELWEVAVVSSVNPRMHEEELKVPAKI